MKVSSSDQTTARVKQNLCRNQAQEKVKIHLSGGDGGDLAETWKPEFFMDPISHTIGV